MNLFDNETISARMADERYRGSGSCYGCLNKMCDGSCELDIENGCLDYNGERLKFQLKEIYSPRWHELHEVEEILLRAWMTNKS